MMSIYIRDRAIRWCISELGKLPKDQTALLYFLIFARCPTVDPGQERDNADFENEFFRYFGAPLRGGGKAAFDPFGGRWKAENYIYSSVYGRLINNSHWWTQGDDALFKRVSKTGDTWPAEFRLTDEGFDNLIYRQRPPNLKYKNRLPLSVMAIYYFRFEDLNYFSPKKQTDLIDEYRKLVLSKHTRLEELFVPGPAYRENDLFQSKPPTEKEMRKCYPKSPHASNPKVNARIFQDDKDYIMGRLKEGQDIADYIRDLIRS